MSTRELHQWRPDISFAVGPQHTIRAELRRMEKRAEVVVDWRHARVDRRGVLTAPYIRLKTRGRVRRARAIRVTAFGVGASMFLASVAWLAWESRYVIMAAGVLALLALVVWLYLTHAHGCPGHHCAGCQG